MIAAAHGSVNGAPIRAVSVMAPMWNESRHVEQLVADLAAQDFRGELEFLVADGGSTDDSVARLRAAAASHELAVTVLDNPERWVSPGLNRCVRAASGELIIRVDCHSRYPTDYIRRCVEVAEETGAANVGGVVVPAGTTATERAFAVALTSPFGGVHWNRHGSRDRVETDTVPYGAFRRDAFERAGLFDESLVRNQDDEFNLRLRLTGGRVILDPTIRTYYTPRGSFPALFRQYYEYGLWKPVVMRKHGRVVSGRSLTPAFFVGSALALGALAPRRSARRLLAVEFGAYSAAMLASATTALRNGRESHRLFVQVAAAFPTMHLAYGLGMFAGLARVALAERAKTLRRTRRA